MLGHLTGSLETFRHVFKPDIKPRATLFSICLNTLSLFPIVLYCTVFPVPSHTLTTIIPEMSVDMKSNIAVDNEILYQLERFENCNYPIKFGLRHFTLSSFTQQFVNLAHTLRHTFFI